MVPFPAGTASEGVTRRLAESTHDQAGATVLVENRPLGPHAGRPPVEYDDVALDRQRAEAEFVAGWEKLGSDRFPRKHRATEANGERLEPLRRPASESRQDGSGCNTKRAKSVQDRSLKARLSGGFWISMDRIVVAAKPIDEG
jgi:hypothetical protein